jgi:hypothetical protein
MQNSNIQQYPLPVSASVAPQVSTPQPQPNPGCLDLVHIAQELQEPQAPSVTKEQLKDHLRQWVRVENEISTLSAEIKKAGTTKKSTNVY